ncbi:glycosyltransferase family 4 protein [Leifsonia aquatica]|jgi:glycosyltransferase involved in cell wall biosynthesis|uniref:Glycosyltransferase, group 1 family protein n=2 Tax=Leifsonia aquatica TaxID=144185 RepID=U2RRM5_LEIAQ|nr:glycosyltransferase family 1 protein [Leifsonia aquatica]ERK71224.1 glycosyltransferase, group 1 family protein [Leifsonia aquatica ATCC 14665]MBB2965470.1 glycosyltransferase involved in cell wall biosynthesis [Leifsonia aquatica]
MPRILVDLLFYTGTKGGMESYVRNVYRELGGLTDGLEYTALLPREAESLDLGWFPGDVVRSSVSGEARASWALGELRSVPAAARRIGADLIHAPANIGPIRSRVPVVLTVHDLLPFVHPEWVPGPYSPVLRALISRAARNARRVITVSEQSRADLQRILRLGTDTVDVVPLAGLPVSERTASAHRADDLILSLGNRMPHKNFETLLTAIARIPSEARPRLVITGSHGDDPLRPLVERLGIAATTTLLGWVDDDEIERLYSEATAVVVPTLFEGFGLPVLEAMSRGCPVICSDLPVLREVGGDAALYVDPRDPDGLADALRALLGDAAARERRSSAGLARAEGFSWARTALATAESFQRALDE